MKLYEKRRAWCVALKANVYDKPGGKVIETVKLGKAMRIVSHEYVEDMLHISWHNNKVDGWIHRNALTVCPVENYARLEFVNATGKRVPCTKRMRGSKVIGFILPGEHVEVIVKAGNWCLTDHGWTLFKWLTKVKHIETRAIGVVMYEVLRQAAKDYGVYVRRLKRSQYLTDEGILDTLNHMEAVMEWFLSDEFTASYDGMKGAESLDNLNAELEIDRAWLKKWFAERNRLIRRGVHVKHDPFK